MPAKLTALSHLGLAVETTLGTPVAATGWVPVLTFKPQDVLKYIEDTGYRGQPVEDYGEYLGVTSSTYEVDGDFFPGAGGNFLAAIFGKDTVAGTAAPYTHTFSTLGTGLPSYTISDYYVAGARQWAGSRCDKLSLKFTADAGLTYTASFIGFPSATYAVEATTTFGTSPFFLGWEAVLKFAGVQDANLESFTLDLQRVKSAPLFSAANTKSPYDIFLGPLKASWQLSFFANDDTEYTKALSQATAATQVVVTQPGTGDSLTLTSSAVQFTKPTINRGKDYVVVDISGEAVYNATDASVATAVLVNATSTAYSTTAAS
ncbi:MAG: phage tail tube protein [Acidimicrobiales bacterium]